MRFGETMSETVRIVSDGAEYETEMTENLRKDLANIGFYFPNKSEQALAERVEELMYDLVKVEPRGAIAHTEVEVSYEGEASFDHGQPTKLDHADDVEIRMIRPDRITVGWSEENE